MDGDTVWLNQAQMIELIQSSKSNINEHIKPVFEKGELEESSIVRKFRTIGSDGKTCNVNFYHLDVIISVGYQVRPGRGQISPKVKLWKKEKEEAMSKRGRNINLYLMDGEPGGRMKCTLANWTGVAYKIPRTELDQCKERDDLKQSGIYFLFGISDQTGENVVYVGQAGARKNGEGILFRLQEHKRNADKDYWTEAVVFTTSNNSFGPTEISYLENRFCNLAKEAKRYQVKNGNEPTPGNVTEEKESELEEFIDNAKIIVGTLGHKLFESLAPITILSASVVVDAEDEQILYLKRMKENAKGRRTNEGFVVFKGGIVSENPTTSCPDGIKQLREKYTEKIDDNNVLTEDILFKSPSAAAAFVTFASANGLVMWVNDNGKSLKDLESSI